MTYVLAWKTESEVFLAADSALTTRNPDSQRESLRRSSFGEDHIFEEDRIVEERVLKLFLINDIGVAIAGRYDTAIEMVKTFYENLAKGQNPKEALDWSVFTWYPSLRDGIVQLAVAYFDDGPHLLSFDGENPVDENQTIVHFGSAPPGYKRLNETWLADLATHPSDRQLAAMLGVLQSHGFLNMTLQRGIGGAFAGLYVDRSGGKWQPDTLFIEDGDPRLVSTSIREDCLVVNSPSLGESRCFLTYLPPRDVDFLKEQTTRAMNQGRALKDSALYDYVFIMSVPMRSLTLIHMDKKLRHFLLWLEPFVDEDGAGTKVLIFEPLRDIINRTDQGIIVALYKESIEKDIPGNRRVTREVRRED